MIAIKNISKKYITGNRELIALDNINLEIDSRSFISIVGRSGSGKSTLLHLLGLIDNPTSGEIIFDNVNSKDMNSREKALFRNRNIGFIFQSFHLEPTYTVHENIEMPLLIAGVRKEDRKALVENQLRRMGLFDRDKEIVNKLSGGERQRIAIARALVNKPKLILADEPCGNLDIKNSQNIMNILRSLTDEDITVILVTHNLEDARIADRVITLEDGRIVNEENIL